MDRFSCPPDGPRIQTDNRSGEKFANCRACARCQDCVHDYGIGTYPAKNEGVVQRLIGAENRPYSNTLSVQDLVRPPACRQDRKEVTQQGGI